MNTVLIKVFSKLLSINKKKNQDINQDFSNYQLLKGYSKLRIKFKIM